MSDTDATQVLTVPRRAVGSPAYAAAAVARWHRVHAATPIVRRPPRQFGRRRVDFQHRMASSLPELGVLELPRASVVGQKGWIVSSDGWLLSDHSWHGRDLSTHIPSRGPHQIDWRKGVVASLLTEFAAVNYGHFVLDSLGRADLLMEAGLWDAIDWFVCATPNERAGRLLDHLAIPPERRITGQKGVAIQGDTVLAPSFPGIARNYAPWLPDFLRRNVGSPPNGSGRRLYVRRLRSRRIHNEQELLPLLAQHGLESYVPDEHPDPPADFAAADVIVGVHGANLTDIAFCRPGTRVLELIPSRHQEPYWYNLADAAGLDYGYLLVDSTSERAPSYDRMDAFDVHVDPIEFAAALAATVDGQRE